MSGAHRNLAGRVAPSLVGAVALTAALAAAGEPGAPDCAGMLRSFPSRLQYETEVSAAIARAGSNSDSVTAPLFMGRRAAIDALGAARCAEAFAPLQTVLEDPREGALAEPAARALARIDPGAALDLFVRAADDGDPRLRGAVISGLALVPGPEAVTSLAGFLDAKSTRELRSVFSAIALHPFSETRETVLDLLGSRGSCDRLYGSGVVLLQLKEGRYDERTSDGELEAALAGVVEEEGRDVNCLNSGPYVEAANSGLGASPRAAALAALQLLRSRHGSGSGALADEVREKILKIVDDPRGDLCARVNAAAVLLRDGWRGETLEALEAGDDSAIRERWFLYILLGDARAVDHLVAAIADDGNLEMHDLFRLSGRRELVAAAAAWFAKDRRHENRKAGQSLLTCTATWGGGLAAP